MKKLNCIMLVDDDETVNFHNEYLLKEAGVAEEIKIATNGQKALEYIEASCKENSGLIAPDIVFLDINMPVMDGFEFLEACRSIGSKMLVCMLTTSLHEIDKHRASNLPNPIDFILKPLSEKAVLEIINKHFKD